MGLQGSWAFIGLIGFFGVYTVGFLGSRAGSEQSQACFAKRPLGFRVWGVAAQDLYGGRKCAESPSHGGQQWLGPGLGCPVNIASGLRVGTLGITRQLQSPPALGYNWLMGTFECL